MLCLVVLLLIVGPSILSLCLVLVLLIGEPRLLVLLVLSHLAIRGDMAYMVNMMCKGGYILLVIIVLLLLVIGGPSRVVASLSNLAIWSDKGVFASRNFFQDVVPQVFHKHLLLAFHVFYHNFLNDWVMVTL